MLNRGKTRQLTTCGCYKHPFTNLSNSERAMRDDLRGARDLSSEIKDADCRGLAVRGMVKMAGKAIIGLLVSKSFRK